ncbi:NADH dehydrogenase [ubiquinone] iron-sulfur protein 6, mitochondrial, partial [Bos mutus]
QVYDDGDYRKVRFVGRQKEVNENFAIDLIAEQPVSQVGSRVISCDGGGGALGHPRVYINLVMCCPAPSPSPGSCPVLSPLAAHARLGPAHEPSTRAEQRAGTHRASRTG